MQIKIVKSPAGIGYAYAPGECPDVPDAFGNELIEQGYAVALHRLKTMLPEDIPGRKVLVENEFESIDELRNLTVDELMTIKGIGKKMAESIVNYLQK